MCKHVKVYQHDIILMTLPPKILWECSKCGESGYDIERDDSTLNRIRDEISYELLN